MPFVAQARNLGTIVSDICRSVSVEYPSTVLPDASAPSTDPVILRMVQAVSDAGEKLLTMRVWQELNVTATLSVVADFAGQREKGFSLPSDFYAFIDRTQNDATMRLPAVGPVGAIQWEAIQTLSPQVAFSLLWRYDQGQIVFLNPPSTARTFQYEYVSRGIWTYAGDTYERPPANAAVPVLDSTLVMLLGKARWLEMSGFDASAAMRDFDEAYNLRAPAREGAKTLDMSGGPFNPLRLLSAANLPETGYGS